MNYNDLTGMQYNERPYLLESQWKDVKEAIDLYREKNLDAKVQQEEWQEVKQACCYILEQYGLWNHEHDRLDEPSVTNLYDELR